METRKTLVCGAFILVFTLPNDNLEYKYILLVNIVFNCKMFFKKH